MTLQEPAPVQAMGRKVEVMTEVDEDGDTPAARRSARISAARALVRADKRLGLTTDPAIVALANASRRTEEFERGTEGASRSVS